MSITPVVVSYAEIAAFSLENGILNIYEAGDAYQHAHGIKVMQVDDAPDDLPSDDRDETMTFSSEAAESYGVEGLRALVEEHGINGVRNLYPELLA